MTWSIYPVPAYSSLLIYDMVYLLSACLLISACAPTWVESPATKQNKIHTHILCTYKLCHERIRKHVTLRIPLTMPEGIRKVVAYLGDTPTQVHYQYGHHSKKQKAKI